MARRALLLAWALVAPALAAPAAGGKVPWGIDLDEALRVAAYERKPVVLFFSAEWCQYCQQMAAGALSDDAVVKAFQGAIPVLIDCTAKGSHPALHERYKVEGYPRLVFLDHQGKLLGQMVGVKTAPQLLEGLAIAQKHVAELTRPKPRPKAGAPEPDVTPGQRSTVHELASLDEALERARAEGKLLALVFTLPEQARREADVQAVVEALRAPSLKATAPRFLYVWQPLCDDLGLDTKDAEAWRAQKSPSLVVLDPWVEPKPGQRRPALVSVNKVADVPGELGRALVEAARAGHPPAAAEPGEQQPKD